MRSDTGLRETYVELARTIENELRLADMMPEAFNLGVRDTFPFEERRLLCLAVTHIMAGKIPDARMIIEHRKSSIWRRDPARTPAWTALERSLDLLETVETVIYKGYEKAALCTLVKAYAEGGLSDMDRYQRLFETAITACPDEQPLSPLIDQCRKRYLDAAEKLQNTFVRAVNEQGWPPENFPRQTRIFDEHAMPVLERRERLAVFLVDSLRYEMGRDLADALAAFGDVEIGCAAGVLPTITSCGMAALMPGAEGSLRLVEKDGGLVPAIGTRLLKTSSDRMNLLAELYGDRFVETTMDDLLGAFKKVSKSCIPTENGQKMKWRNTSNWPSKAGAE